MITFEAQGRIDTLTAQVDVKFGDGSTPKREMTISCDGGHKYPTILCIPIWGDKCADLARLKPGDVVEVRASVKCKRKQSATGNLYWQTILAGVRCRKLYDDGTTKAEPEHVIRADMNEIPSIAGNVLPPVEEEVPF